jgi:hypothetical protein
MKFISKENLSTVIKAIRTEFVNVWEMVLALDKQVDRVETETANVKSKTINNFREINKIREEYVSKEGFDHKIADIVNPIIDGKVQSKIEQYNLHDFPEAKATLVDLKATVEDHYVKKDNLEELVAAIFGEASVEELKRKLQNLATVTPPVSGEQ